MAALVWSNVTETANVSVQKGTPEHIVKTFLQQKHYVRTQQKPLIFTHTFNVHHNLQAIFKLIGAAAAWNNHA